MLSLEEGRHKRFKYSIMYNSLELRQTQTQVLTLLPGHIFLLAWDNNGGLT